MNLSFITLFPGLIEAYCQESMVGKAIKAGLISMKVANPRDFAYDRHRTVDDSPCGGGPGMVMKAEPVMLALENVRSNASAKVIVVDPVAPVFTQADAQQFATMTEIILVCGHYEGIDERFYEVSGADRRSIGNFVLTGGELAALTIADATARMVPGVLGNAESPIHDSFAEGFKGMLAPPCFTRPVVWRGVSVPDVLMSGNHAAMEKWRTATSFKRTQQFRPDLLENS